MDGLDVSDQIYFSHICTRYVNHRFSTSETTKTHQRDVNAPVDAVAINDQVGEENDGQIASVECRDGHRWRRKELRQGREPTSVLWHW